MDTLTAMLDLGYIVRLSKSGDNYRADVTRAGEVDTSVTRPTLAYVLSSLATIFLP